MVVTLVKKSHPHSHKMLGVFYDETPVLVPLCMFTVLCWIIMHKQMVPAGACLSLFKSFTSQDSLCLQIVKLFICMFYRSFLYKGFIKALSLSLSVCLLLALYLGQSSGDFYERLSRFIQLKKQSRKIIPLCCRN